MFKKLIFNFNCVLQSYPFEVVEKPLLLKLLTRLTSSRGEYNKTLFLNLVICPITFKKFNFASFLKPLFLLMLSPMIKIAIEKV